VRDAAAVAALPPAEKAKVQQLHANTGAGLRECAQLLRRHLARVGVRVRVRVRVRAGVRVGVRVTVRVRGRVRVRVRVRVNPNLR